MNTTADFKAGDIVTTSPKHFDQVREGIVTAAHGDYLHVRLQGGIELDYYPHELNTTGRRMDPVLAKEIAELDEAIATAEKLVRTLKQARQTKELVTGDKQ